MKYGVYLVVVVLFLLSGCSSKEVIPLKMKVTKIEISTVSVANEVIPLLIITDQIKITSIVKEINNLKESHFDDPEKMGNLYQVIFLDSENNHIDFLYNDLVQFGGKIYTEESAKKGKVWAVNESLANLLLGDNRKPLANP